MAKTVGKRAAQQGFEKACGNGYTPEEIVLARARGQHLKRSDGTDVLITESMYQAAAALLPYRLPRLNSVDAFIGHTEMTHEDWVKSLDGVDDGDD